LKLTREQKGGKYQKPSIRIGGRKRVPGGKINWPFLFPIGKGSNSFFEEGKKKGGKEDEEKREFRACFLRRKEKGSL